MQRHGASLNARSRTEPLPVAIDCNRARNRFQISDFRFHPTRLKQNDPDIPHFSPTGKRYRHFASPCHAERIISLSAVHRSPGSSSFNFEGQSRSARMAISVRIIVPWSGPCAPPQCRHCGARGGDEASSLRPVPPQGGGCSGLSPTAPLGESSHRYPTLNLLPARSGGCESRCGELVCGVSLLVWRLGQVVGGLGMCFLGASFSFLVGLFGGVWADGVGGRSRAWVSGDCSSSSVKASFLWALIRFPRVRRALGLFALCEVR